MASNGNNGGANGNGSDSGNGDVSGNAATTSRGSAAGDADRAVLRAMRLSAMHLDTQAAATTVPVVQAAVSAIDSLQAVLTQAQAAVSAAKAKDVTITSLYATIAQLQAEADTAKAATAAATATITQLQAEAATANAATAAATASITHLQAETVTTKAEAATATSTVEKMRGHFVCSVCSGYVPVKGYGVECVAGHATCKECSQGSIEYGDMDDGSEDVEVPLPKCPICRLDVSPPFQCAFYMRIADELIYDCRLEHGGCG